MDKGCSVSKRDGLAKGLCSKKVPQLYCEVDWGWRLKRVREGERKRRTKERKKRGG
jgi:hypothetical protein